jgi:hypothetical protein
MAGCDHEKRAHRHEARQNRQRFAIVVGQEPRRHAGDDAGRGDKEQRAAGNC